MEVLREEDERTLSVTSPQTQSSSEGRKNSANFGVRTYIQAPSGADDDDGLLLDLNNAGADQRRATLGSVKASPAAGRFERVRNRWQTAARRVGTRSRQFLNRYVGTSMALLYIKLMRSRINLIRIPDLRAFLAFSPILQNVFTAPIIYRILTFIRWQILLTIGCVTLSIGIVLVGIGMIYHDHQILFPKDHEIQYLSVADWRLNRRFRALRSIGAILFGAGGGLALTALGISVLSKCKQRHDQQPQHQQQLDDDAEDDGMSSTSTIVERRLFQVTPSYQPIEPGNNNASGAPSSTSATGAAGDRSEITIQLTSTDNKQQPISSSSRRKSHSGSETSQKSGSRMSSGRKSIQPHHELPQFPTGNVSVEAVQMTKKAEK